MSRLAASVACDVRLQLRNGFYAAAAFVAVFFVLLLGLVSREDLVWLIPAGLFGNLMTNNYYFIAGLVLLEKREGTIEAVVVTPLRRGEYLASKAATLTGLSLLENVAIVVLAYGPGFRPLPLVLGIVLASWIYALVGFVAVARYDSINEYLFPSFVWVMLLSIPYISYFDLWQSPLFRLHPMHGPLLLMKAAFRPVPPWEQVVGVLVPLLWLVPAFAWSRRSFERFVVAREGVR